MNLARAQAVVAGDEAELCEAREEINAKTETYNELVKGFEEVNRKECEKLKEQLLREVQEMVNERKGKGGGEEL